MKKVAVFNTVISIDMPDLYFNENMEKYFCDNSRDEDVTIAISRGKMIEAPNDAAKEMYLHGHMISSFNRHVFCIRSEYDKVTYFKYNNEYTRFVININDQIDLGDTAVVEALKVEISSVLRRVFIMLAALRHGVCIHSSSIRLDDEAIVFSAVSGMGKSTHADLWRTRFGSAEIINGDNIYLVVENGIPYVFGSPWCGTSNKCVNTKAPLKAIVFLEQAKENTIEKLCVAESFMRLSARCFMPHWDNKLMLEAINTAETLTGIVDCYLLRCLPDLDSVRVCYNGIY